MGRESLRVPLIRDKSSSSRALTPDSSTPSSRKMERGAAIVVVDAELNVRGVDDDENGVEANVVRCVENVDLWVDCDVDERSVVDDEGDPMAERCVEVGISFVNSISDST